MRQEDKYAVYRDEKGRFVKGNPGGPGRPKNSYRTYIIGKNVSEEWNILLQKPPRCLCGTRDYRYKQTQAVIFARCNHCHQEYVYDDQLTTWSLLTFTG